MGNAEAFSLHFPRSKYFLITLNAPSVLKGKEQDGRFKGDLKTNPTACPEGSGQDGACGEGPRL